MPRPVTAPALEQVKTWAREIEPALAVPDTAEAIRDWQPRLKEEMREVLTIRPGAFEQPTVEEFETFEHGNLNVRRVLIEPPDEAAWEAVILEPKGIDNPRPGLVCCHGHLPGGMSSMIGLVIDEPGGEESLQLCRSDYALRLAERGFVTISMHFPGFGSRRDDDSDTPSDLMVNTHLRLGRTYIGWCTENAITAMSALVDWPTVDAERVGSVGFSMGATVAQFHALFDTRVRAAVISGKFGQANRRLANASAGGPVGLAPGMASLIESKDNLSALVPLPLFVNQEVRHDLEESKSDLAHLHRTYELLGAAAMLNVNYDQPDPPDHRFIGEMAYQWMEDLFQ